MTVVVHHVHQLGVGELGTQWLWATWLWALQTPGQACMEHGLTIPARERNQQPEAGKCDKRVGRHGDSWW